jgi:hypothetical protein
VTHPLRGAWVGQAAGQTLRDPEPAIDLRQQEHPGVGGQPAAVEGDPHSLAGSDADPGSVKTLSAEIGAGLVPMSVRPGLR